MDTVNKNFLKHRIFITRNYTMTFQQRNGGKKEFVYLGKSSLFQREVVATGKLCKSTINLQVSCKSMKLARSKHWSRSPLVICNYPPPPPPPDDGTDHECSLSDNEHLMIDDKQLMIDDEQLMVHDEYLMTSGHDEVAITTILVLYIIISIIQIPPTSGTSDKGPSEIRT